MPRFDRLGRLGRNFILLSIVPAVSSQPADPPQLSYATYVTAQPNSEAFGLAVDSAGFAYVAGQYSDCAFLTKLDHTGATAIWSVCLPMYSVSAVAIDKAGYIYAAGDNQPYYIRNAASTAAVVKLSPDAKQVIYSTTISGAHADKLVVDKSGNAYLLGVSESNFQTTPGAYLQTPGRMDFVVKLDVAGSVQYATYVDLLYWLSVPPHETADIAVDSQGQVWVVGATCPYSGGTDCKYAVGTASGIRKLDANGSHVLFSMTFGGGAGGDHGIPFTDAALGVAVDATDAVWVVGTSERFTVPTTPDALEPQSPRARNQGGGGGIAYALKLSSAGDLLYGTYVGDNPGGVDRTIESIAIDAQGNPFFAMNNPDPSIGGLKCGTASAAVMGLSADGSTQLFGTLLLSRVHSVALDNNGGLYTTGTTLNRAFLTTSGVYQQFYPGGTASGYAARYDLTTPGTVSQLYCVMNGASLTPGAWVEVEEDPDQGSASTRVSNGDVAPGEVVTLAGNALPANPVVTFDGIPAPVLYADSQQINAVVPFALNNAHTVVAVAGTNSLTLPVSPAVPGLFTTDGSGFGQVVALNEDGTMNSGDNPAKAGSVISVFVTGAGAMMPPIGDGELGSTDSPLPMPVLTASATLGSTGAEPVDLQVVNAVQAPGMIAGVVRLDLRLPDNGPTGYLALWVGFGDYQSPVRDTVIAVQ